jgi:SAM-dependent methyltransferase
MIRIIGAVFCGTLLAATFACAPAARPPAGVDWIDPDDPRRDAMPATRAILDALSPRPGETIADIGAGGGYFSFKIARLVGPEGRVIATDSDPACIKLIGDHAKARGVDNVIAVRVDPDEIGIGETLDKVLMVNLFYFKDPGETRKYFERLRERLAPEGRIVIYQDETGCPPDGPGAGWNGCVLSGDEMAAALRGPFRFERAAGFGAKGEPYLLVLRKNAVR